MAESESIDCPCSNIAIMQLFHELKQSYPAVPDQIVSRIIQENYHDKRACETILQKESYAFLQSYPGSIISGNPRESLERGSLCSQCPASRSFSSSNDVTHAPKCAMPDNWSQSTQQEPQKQQTAFSFVDDSGIYMRQKSENGECLGDKPEIKNSKEKVTAKENSVVKKFNINKLDLKQENSYDDISKRKNICFKAEDSLIETSLESSSENERQKSDGSSKSSCLNCSNRTCCSECDIVGKPEYVEKSHLCDRIPNLSGAECNEVETVKCNATDEDRISREPNGIIEQRVSAGEISVHNYQVAVQYSMQPALPLRPGSQQRSFTTVNLSLRPPSSEPQPPIEIQSGQNLTYTTSIFDAKKGVQSQLQIRVGPGGGGTVSACRTYISSPQTRFSCRSPSCNPQISTGFQCQNNHHLKALLEKQRERKDLLARELRKEKEKLWSMQNEIKMMKTSIAQKPSPQLLPKLKSEIEKLRAECERLTAAVDLYSDTQNNLPLGETDEEFYRNIYTGQRLQREGSWSCQLCTFRNHPLLSVCEECEMPRISLGTRVMDVTSPLSVLSNNNTPFCTVLIQTGLIQRPNKMISAPVFLSDYTQEEGHPHPRHSSLPPFKNGEQLGSLNREDIWLCILLNELHNNKGEKTWSKPPEKSPDC